MIDQDRHPCWTDFGDLNFEPDFSNCTVESSDNGTTRWMSPELLDPRRFGLQNSQNTKESDCYALGMVILEVLSGQVPFASYHSNTVMLKVLNGEHPERPQEAWFTSDVWGTLEGCWAPQPRDRPELEVVLQCLEEASASWATLFHQIPSTAGPVSRSNSCTTANNYAQVPVRLGKRSNKFSDQRSDDLARRDFDVENLDKVMSFHQPHLQSY